ncbi:gliding motility lipoprotein GldB [Croceiramulus getboli]|nr:gliding motility lipoprotein GldB [Flavobacteriaceae bacterium YJPT1-3]
MINQIRLLFPKILGFLVLLGLCLACEQEPQVPEQIAAIPVDLKITRFDLEMAQSSPEDLPKLKQKYPLLYPKQYPDSFWIAKMQDTLQEALNREVAKAFPDFAGPKEDLDLLFKHIKYYYPETELPRVITLTTDVDYRNKVILADSLLLIATDTYLGADHEFYAGIPLYLVEDFRPDQMAIDVAYAFAKTKVRPPQARTFLAQMIYEGKLLYLMKRLFSLKSQAEVLGYSPQQLDWVQANEAQIWTYFIENDLLFSSDPKLTARFIDPAPFSKFYLELDNESPGGVGRFVGMEIVKSYMENQETDVETLLGLSAQSLFEQSNYKPRK